MQNKIFKLLDDEDMVDWELEVVDELVVLMLLLNKLDQALGFGWACWGATADAAELAGVVLADWLDDDEAFAELELVAVVRLVEAVVAETDNADTDCESSLFTDDPTFVATWWLLRSDFSIGRVSWLILLSPLVRRRTDDEAELIDEDSSLSDDVIEDDVGDDTALIIPLLPFMSAVFDSASFGLLLVLIVLSLTFIDDDVENESGLVFSMISVFVAFLVIVACDCVWSFVLVELFADSDVVVVVVLPFSLIIAAYSAVW